jgi:hypothetical protein
MSKIPRRDGWLVAATSVRPRFSRANRSHPVSAPALQERVAAVRWGALSRAGGISHACAMRLRYLLSLPPVRVLVQEVAPRSLA